jgi:hypothetical protein
MNSGQDASPGSPDAEVPDVDTDLDADIDPGIDPDLDTETLRRSRDAIDQGRDAAREALQDDAGWTPEASEEPHGAEEDAG